MRPTIPLTFEAGINTPVAVDRLRVARYYLQSELGGLIPGNGQAVRKARESCVAALSEQETWRLLEAFSFTYRANGVFFLVTDSALDWYEVELPLSALSMTGIDPTVDRITSSKEINRSVVKFGEFLRDYFTEHPSSDPEGLNEFRPDGRAVHFDTVMVREHRGRIGMIDGSHRVMQLVAKGAASVHAYCAIPNGKRSRSMAGDSVFIRLLDLYASRYKQSDQRQSILDVAALIARSSTDGREAITRYWIDHRTTPSIKRAGRDLLDRLP